MTTSLYSDGKGITVETVTLTCTAEPSRFGDPEGDGQHLLVRDHGTVMEYIPAWRFARNPERALARWCKLADLHEVPAIQRRN